MLYRAISQIYWLHMVYAALGAICFTLVSLVPFLGGEAGRVEMEFRQLGRWGGALDNCSFLFRASRSFWHPFVFCSHSLLCNDSVSALDREVNSSRAETVSHYFLVSPLASRMDSSALRTFC